jgi:putative endonuclease
MQLPKNTRKSGNFGEDLAVELLKRRGYKILTRNFHSHFGEIDVIAKDGDTLVFVEVKARWNKKYGAPEEAITPTKIYRIKKTAEFYLLLHNLKTSKLRIEVIALQFFEGKIASFKIIKLD